MAASLRVMTFNVRYGTADDGPDRWALRRPHVEETLARRHPDLVGLQEAVSFQIDELAAAGGYVAVGAGRDDGRASGEHAAILYDPARLRLRGSDTFWLSPTPHRPGSMGWGSRHPRVCTVAHFLDRETGGGFDHFNLHLDHESSAARENGARLVLGRILVRAPQDPVVVTGDFNAGERDPAIAQMVAAGFRDAFRVVHPDAPDAATFNGWEDPPSGEKIDYVFVEGATKVAEAEIVRDRAAGRWLSDHMPIMATLIL